MATTKRPIALIAAGFLLVVSGCGDVVEPPAADERGPAATGLLVSDEQSMLTAELEEADREFARRVGETRLDGWVEAFSENGMVLPKDGPVTKGPSAIRGLFAPMFADPGFEITWAPAGAEVAKSGDMGFTHGDWKTSVPSPGGEVREAEGKYVTIWTRDSEGKWRVLLDIGNTQPAPEAWSKERQASTPSR